MWASENIFNNKVISLNEARDKLKVYLIMDEWDFMGRKGEKLYFQLQENYAQGNLIKKLIFDLSTLDYQIKIFCKVFDDNIYVYEGLGIIVGYNYIINASKISKIRKIKYKLDLLKNLFGLFGKK